MEKWRPHSTRRVKALIILKKSDKWVISSLLRAVALCQPHKLLLEVIKVRRDLFRRIVITQMSSILMVVRAQYPRQLLVRLPRWAPMKEFRHPHSGKVLREKGRRTALWPNRQARLSNYHQQSVPSGPPATEQTNVKEAQNIGRFTRWRRVGLCMRKINRISVI